MKPIEIIKEAVPNQEQANELMQRLFDAAQPAAVFGEPVTQGEYTAITAAEISAGMGYGFGGGGSLGEADNVGEQGEEAKSPGAGFGSGGGGGGATSARPVAVIEIGPHGVRVEPIVDPTKIVLAFFTAFGTLVAIVGKVRRAALDT